MVEVLEFIFQSFWHRLGTLIMLAVIVGGLNGVFRK